MHAPHVKYVFSKYRFRKKSLKNDIGNEKNNKIDYTFPHELKEAFNFPK